MKMIPIIEARTVVLLIALAIGCGLAVHPLFFAVAVGMALLVAIEWTLNELRKFLVQFRTSRFAH